MPSPRTVGVTSGVAAADVWPWLLQLGQGRGGPYSYDWLENLLGLDIHSAEDIDVSLQTLPVGDVVGLVPDHFVMERKMLLGIKRRAERAPHHARPLAAVPT